VFGHGPADVDHGHDIVVVIAEGVDNGLRNGLEPDKVYGGIEPLRLAQTLYLPIVPKIDFGKAEFLSEDSFDAFRHFRRTAAEVVRTHGLIPVPEKLDATVAPDISGTARNQYFLNSQNNTFIRYLMTRSQADDVGVSVKEHRIVARTPS
jgi:hypothetical protein